jgi:hypothetical protein
MYIVGRSRRINQARGRAAVAAAIEAGSRASEIVGLPVFVWSSVFSADGPAVSWSARVEHLADAVALDDKMFADEGFAQWVEDNDGLFLGPTSDVISQVVHGAPTGPPKAYVQLTRAICANGSLSEGMGVGIELAETAERITGMPVMFVTPVVGDYGGVGWMVTAEDLAEVEAANAALSTDDDWLKLVDRAGHAFNPGTSSIILRRIG